MTPTFTPKTQAPSRPRRFVVVHPLDDAFEAKLPTENLGPMRLTRTVRICLFALRGYLWVIFGLLGIWSFQLAGVIR